MNTLAVADIQAIFKKLDETMTEQKDFLVDLDAAVGDGDLGVTMKKGFHAAAESISTIEESDVGHVMAKAGMAIAQAAPSTMGTLVGSGFMKAGKALKGHTEIALTDVAEAMTQFVEAVMARGKAKPGEKTLVDSINPAAQALQEAVRDHLSLEDAVKNAAEAAYQGLEATKEMVPQHGKQVPHREKSKGRHDPGATVGMLIMRVFSEYVNTLP
ncbi:dihydroxyacetone kinase subunit L [candidate division KSB3 bacterium]|uniref:Dihydroxyacetone kinase subunit L n=1 Tax=candidate division KSB3 bacterium TaxID=2044937 RepID=A0A2G6E377_9BACT|nr:MAG: dihydroxyacetone kinase subunit L [candidate division KSB3 bacterium]PIE28883.1 MAG: dihydroxyacetone kinase subunit L [candidate division KSB3 bacterium]